MRAIEGIAIQSLLECQKLTPYDITATWKTPLQHLRYGGIGLRFINDRRERGFEITWGEDPYFFYWKDNEYGSPTNSKHIGFIRNKCVNAIVQLIRDYYDNGAVFEREVL